MNEIKRHLILIVLECWVRSFLWTLWVQNHSHVTRVYFSRCANWIQMPSANICICCFDSPMPVGCRNRRQFSLSETPWTSQTLPRSFGKQNITYLLSMFQRVLSGSFCAPLQHNNSSQCPGEIAKIADFFTVLSAYIMSLDRFSADSLLALSE